MMMNYGRMSHSNFLRSSVSVSGKMISNITIKSPRLSGCLLFGNPSFGIRFIIFGVMILCTVSLN